MNFLKPSLDKQVADELYLCERELLEAEGALENWTAKVQMLKNRRYRLNARLQHDEVQTELRFSNLEP